VRKKVWGIMAVKFKGQEPERVSAFRLDREESMKSSAREVLKSQSS